MTVNVNDGQISITATGGETSLSFDFLIYAESDLLVRKRTSSGTLATLILNTDYTVPAGSINNTSGGPITLSTAATAGDVYTLASNVSEARAADYQQAGDLKAATLNGDFDKVIRLTQQLRRDLGATISVPTGGDYLDALGYKIKNMGYPASATDAATKAYVDSITSAAGNVTPPVLSEVGGALTATGVGTFGWVGPYHTTPEAHGAIGNGVADDSTAMAAAVATGLPIYLGAGKSYRVTTTALNVTDRDLVLLCSNGIATLVQDGNVELVRAEAAFSSIQTVSAVTNNVSRDISGDSSGASTVTTLDITDGTVYAANDLVKVFSDDLLTGPDPADNEREAEFARVSEVVGNKLYLSDNLAFAANYTTGVKVAKMAKQHRLMVKGVKFSFGSNVASNHAWVKPMLRVIGYYAPVVDVEIEKANHIAIQMTSCLFERVKATGGNIRSHSSYAAYGYLAMCDSSEHGTYEVNGFNCRHVFTTGCASTTAGDNDVKSRGRSKYFTVSGHGADNQSSSFDTHCDAFMGQFVGCVESRGFKGGQSGGNVAFSLRGIYNRTIGCASLSGRSFQLISDYGSASNCYENYHINPLAIVPAAASYTDRPPLWALGVSGGILTGGYISPVVYKLGGGGSMAVLQAEYATITLENPIFKLPAMTGSAGRSMLIDQSATIKAKRGVIDATGATATVWDVARIADNSASLVWDDLEVIVGGSNWRSLADFYDGSVNTAGTARFNNVKYDTRHTDSDGKSSGTGSETYFASYNMPHHGAAPDIILRHSVASGATHGGTTVSTTWNTAPINTVERDIVGGVSIGSNQFSLPAGTYYAEATSQTIGSASNLLRLRDVTSPATLVLGDVCYNNTVSAGGAPALLSGYFTITGTKTIELQHYTVNGRATDGFGINAAAGVNNNFRTIKLWRLG